MVVVRGTGQVLDTVEAVANPVAALERSQAGGEGHGDPFCGIGISGCIGAATSDQSITGTARPAIKKVVAQAAVDGIGPVVTDQGIVEGGAGQVLDVTVAIAGGIATVGCRI